MNDWTEALREFQALDERRQAGGLRAKEELRWLDLKEFLAQAEPPAPPNEIRPDESILELALDDVAPLTDDAKPQEPPSPLEWATPSGSDIEYESVVVHTLEGTVLQGRLAKKAALEEAFLTLHTDASEQTLPTHTLKAVYFLHEDVPSLASAEGDLVCATFHDGQMLEGHSTDWRMPTEGFSLTPIDQDFPAARVFIYRTGLQSIHPTNIN